MEAYYPLERTWTIWEMWSQNPQNQENYKENMQPVGDFECLHSFWQHWNYLPHAVPSDLFYDLKSNQQPMVYPEQISVDAVSVFETGVIPAWEDPVNKTGCTVSVRRQVQPEKIKEVWDRLVMSIIGESLPFSEQVVGCRVVSKQKFTKFEVWLKLTCAQDDFQVIVSSVVDALNASVGEVFRRSEVSINDHIRGDRVALRY